MRKLMAGMNIPSGRTARCEAISARAAERRFSGAAALLFAASLLVTTRWCGSLASMPGMPMAGGWRMSMAWMRMPGQSWPAAGTAFVAMWGVMTVAMILPSLLPMLCRYRRSVGMGGRDCGRLTAAVAAGYFLVWMSLGVAVFALGVPLAAAEMQTPALARAVPLASGLLVLAAGGLQLTPWKIRALQDCKAAPICAERRALCALRHGLQLGIRCSTCCAGPTAVLLVLGVMDLQVMAGVTALISAERLAPGGDRLARIGGVALISLGLWLLVRAAR